MRHHRLKEKLDALHYLTQGLKDSKAFGNGLDAEVKFADWRRSKLKDILSNMVISCRADASALESVMHQSGDVLLKDL